MAHPGGRAQPGRDDRQPRPRVRPGIAAHRRPSAGPTFPMDLMHLLGLFVRSVEKGSFSGVARDLGLTQPTISKQIAELEERLRCPLFVRGTRGSKPTDAGAALYPQAKQLIERMGELESGRWRGDPSRVGGTLRVYAPSSFGEAYLTPLLIRLAQSHRELATELVLTDRFVDIVEEGIDVAIRFGPLPPMRLAARKIGESPQACLASPDYLARHGVPKRPSDLLSHHCLVNFWVSPENQWRFTTPRGLQEIQVPTRFRANNLRSIRTAVLSGLGIAVGPEWLYFEDLRSGRVKRVLSRFPPMALDIHALHAPGGFLPERVRLLLDELEREFRETPALAQTFLRGRKGRPAPG
jgi:DNA-binding transcriptional LysR family regulator